MTIEDARAQGFALKLSADKILSVFAQDSNIIL